LYVSDNIEFDGIMKIDRFLLQRIENDLGLNVQFVRGKDMPVSNCWHFYTNGNDIDIMFYDEEDYRAAMNRIFVSQHKFQIIILAFVLMDTHIHFVLWGDYQQCNAFIHDYVKRTSQYIAFKHSEKKKLKDVEISHQAVDTDYYLKTVICYTIKNPSVGGLQYLHFNYPWSSGALIFAKAGSWTSPVWSSSLSCCRRIGDLTVREKSGLLLSKDEVYADARVVDGIVFPGDYVANEIVERLFKSCKSFNYFMSMKKEDEVDAKGGCLSYLSVPISELRQHKTEICRELYGQNTIKSLDTTQRLKLARTIKNKYNCSVKQIAKMCGLIYDEVKNLI